MTITINGSGTITGVTTLGTTLTSPTLTTPIVTTTIGVGNATPSASGSGVSFPATQSASTDANTLDDYEEGTWTPTLTSATGSYTTEGTYVKIGRTVFITAKLTPTAGTITGTRNSTTISNLPFSVSVQSILSCSDAAIQNFGTGAIYASTTAYVPSYSSTNPVYFSGTYTTAN